MLDPLISTLVISHNGLPNELTYVWDGPNMLLTLGGFRTVTGGITWVNISFTLLDNPTLVISERLLITEYMDSNDIKDAILTYLTGAIASLVVEVVYEEPASAHVTFTLELAYYNFDEAALAFALSSDGDCPFSFVETTLQVPLAQVSGISAARGRLLAWDRKNAIYRSALLDPLDFTPSLATQASVGQAQAVRGNIILIAGMPNGYVVYSTDNIVVANYTGDEYLFTYREGASIGISDPKHFAMGLDKHMVYSSGGVYYVEPGTGAITPVDSGLDIYLAQYPWPMRLALLHDRYICISLAQLLEGDVILRTNRAMAQIANLGEVPDTTPISIPNYPVNAALTNTYQRTVIFDLKLEKWGSCDTAVQGLFSCMALNAVGVRLDKIVGNLEEQMGLGDTGIGMVLSDGTIALASKYPDTSLLHIGHLRAQADGWTTLLEIKSNEQEVLAGSLQYRATPYGLDHLPITPGIWQGTIPAQQPDVTGTYVDVHAIGHFNLTQLRFAGIPQARL